MHFSYFNKILIKFLVILILSVCTVSYAAQWPDVRSIGPFIFRADFSMQGIVPFITELANLQNDIIQSLSIAPAQEGIEVYLFHDQQTYEQYLKQHFPNVPFRRAVYLKGRGPGRVFAYYSAQFEIDLRHECTHALLHASLKNIPLWLDEGLAGYFELPADKRVFENPHLANIKRNAWFGVAPSLENLEKCTDIAKMGKAEYRDSWAWICFMLHGPAEANDELKKYLWDIQSQNPQHLFCDRLKHRLPTVQQQFTAFYINLKNNKTTQWAVNK
jgi:hypothetical protein